MLELAEVKEGDVVYDLGCGDGRIPVTAAKKYGVKAVGFDVDPQRIKESNENVEKNGVGKLVTIKQEDIFKQDLSKANVVTLYLLPSLNVKLMPQLRKLKPGSRIVSHSFDMRGAKPKKVVQVQTKEGGEHYGLPVGRPLGGGEGSGVAVTRPGPCEADTDPRPSPGRRWPGRPDEGPDPTVPVLGRRSIWSEPLIRPSGTFSRGRR